MSLSPVVRWLWPGAPELLGMDRGLAYGDGLFETLRITASGPVLLVPHLQRLLRGAARLGIPCENDWLVAWWRSAFSRWQASGRTDGVIKLIWTRGQGGRGYRPPQVPTPVAITSFHEVPALPSASQVEVSLCRTPVSGSALAGLKTLNRLDQVLAAAEVPGHCFEGLMCDELGRPLEGTRSNLMVVADDRLLTPPASRLAVRGVMRDFLLARAETLGLRPMEASLTVSRLQSAQAVLLVNSVFGALAVSKLGCMHLPSNPRVATIRSLLNQEFGL